MTYALRGIVGCLCPHQSVTCVVSRSCLGFLSALWNGRLARRGPHGSGGRLSRRGSGLAPPGGPGLDTRPSHLPRTVGGTQGPDFAAKEAKKEAGKPRTKDEPQRAPTSGEGEERIRGSQTGTCERGRGDPRVREASRRELCPLTLSISPARQPTSEHLLRQRTRGRRMHKFMS